MENKPIYMSLFSGCGGDSLGAEMAGFDVAYHVEWWDLANKTHKINFPDCLLLCKDIILLNNWKMKECVDKEITVIFAGFPCQGFSRQGKRNKKDPRNRLFWEFVRITKELKPYYVIGENVPGILDMPGEREYESAADTICRAFNEIGYKMKYKKLTACDYGAATSRERVIFLGSRERLIPIDFPTPTHTQKAQYTLSGSKLEKFVTLGDILALSRHPDDIQYRVNTKDQERIRKIPIGKILFNVDPNWVHKSSYQRPYPTKPFPTIIKTNLNWVHPFEDRFLSIRELARCQSFPDSFILKGNYEGQMGQIGNSVPPLLAKAIILEVKKVLKGGLVK